MIVVKGAIWADNRITKLSTQLGRYNFTKCEQSYGQLGSTLYLNASHIRGEWHRRDNWSRKQTMIHQSWNGQP